VIVLANLVTISKWVSERGLKIGRPRIRHADSYPVQSLHRTKNAKRTRYRAALIDCQHNFAGARLIGKLNSHRDISDQTTSDQRLISMASDFFHSLLDLPSAMYGSRSSIPP
jgi:hypothetical protein